MTQFEAENMASSIRKILTTPFDLSLGSDRDLAYVKEALERKGCRVERNSNLPLTITISPATKV